MTSITALLSFGLTTAVAIPQSKPGTTNPAKKSSPAATKTIPPIKCTDPDSMVACRSFKQLVDARDKGLLDSLTGDNDTRERHFAYVCLWPKLDTFKIVEFYEPPSGDFHPYSPPDETKDLLVLADGQSAFPYDKGEPVMLLMDARKKWFNDHDDLSVYEFGWVYVDSWENGTLADYVSDYGKWKRPLPQAQSRPNGDATFESAHEWLSHFNSENDDKMAAIDDKERPRIIVGDTSIYVHYSYKNKSNKYTDYTLTIQRSTGRFTESFIAPGLDPIDDFGTCMKFKY